MRDNGSLRLALRTGQRRAREDAVLAFSGGRRRCGKDTMSVNIVLRPEGGEAKRGLKISGVVGRNGGFTKQVGYGCVVKVIPTVGASPGPPHIRGVFPGVVWASPGLPSRISQSMSHQWVRGRPRRAGALSSRPRRRAQHAPVAWEGKRLAPPDSLADLGSTSPGVARIPAPAAQRRLLGIVVNRSAGCPQRAKQ